MEKYGVACVVRLHVEADSEDEAFRAADRVLVERAREARAGGAHQAAELIDEIEAQEAYDLDDDDDDDDALSPNARMFRSSDGYTLYFVDGEWVDSPEEDLVDMTFDDQDGWPVDRHGERLEGRLI
jgi:hypothetical protein